MLRECALSEYATENIAEGHTMLLPDDEVCSSSDSESNTSSLSPDEAELSISTMSTLPDRAMADDVTDVVV